MVARATDAGVRAATEAAGTVAAAAEPYLPEDPRRRKALKYGLLGGGVFLAGKVLGPGLSAILPNEVVASAAVPPVVPNSVPVVSDDGAKEYLFENFRVVEKDGHLGFYDKVGKEILVLENETPEGDQPATL